ncbi:MAG TPA: Ppx/GppA phosphatase family protein [Pyrinomonadaceae bacterium]|nr:Ppx/GppA phosphatase family protein [Pyrinomonadaceae bacterium]
MKLAAIDIGSNSIKLAVVDAVDSNSFAVVTREKDVVRLGHETLRTRHLSREAIERAVGSIQRFKTIAEAHQSDSIVAIATASVREANNAAQFIRQVEQHTGLRVEILSGVEEARLIGLAASHGCALHGATNINVDIGGGSTEISLFRNGTALSLLSLKLGAVRLTERYLRSDPPKQKELASLKTEVHAAFERPKRELQNFKWHQASGTSGTILAIGAALRGPSSNNDRKNQAVQPTDTDIPLSKLAALNARLANLDLAGRRALPGISSQRSEIIVAGGYILEEAMRALGINVLRTCDWALREGAIIDSLRESEDESRPAPEFADQKLRGVHAVGRRFGYEETHARQVSKLAEKIFDCLAPAENLSRHQRTLMLAAALLHDIGYHIAHESHQKHALYLIKNSELTGFSEAERAVIANIARYHRGPLPKERHADFAALNLADRKIVCKLAGIVKLADALDRSHDSRVYDLQCRDERRSLHVELYSAADCSNEMLEVERKRDLFEQSFNRTLSFSMRRQTVVASERI